MSTIVGTPCDATLLFKDEAGAPVTPDHAAFVVSGPGATPDLFDQTDEKVSNPSAGTFIVTFWPSTFGRWWVHGTAYDNADRQVGQAAAAIDVADPPALPTADAAHYQALALVQRELGRPVRFVSGAVLHGRTDRWGELELMLRPIRAVSAVTLESDGSDVSTSWSLRADLNRIVDLPILTEVVATYDHGWHSYEVPADIGTVLESAATRIGANPDNVRSESIDGYSVDYQTVGLPTGLTEDERRVLQPFAVRGRAGTVRIVHR